MAIIVDQMILTKVPETYLVNGDRADAGHVPYEAMDSPFENRIQQLSNELSDRRVFVTGFRGFNIVIGYKVFPPDNGCSNVRTSAAQLVHQLGSENLLMLSSCINGDRIDSGFRSRSTI